MSSAKSSKILLPLTALILALDQRIEIQLLLLVGVAAMSLWHAEDVRWQFGKTVVALGVATGYIALNTAVMFIDAPELGKGWWQAPLRIWIFFLILSFISPMATAQSRDSDAPFKTIEWLFIVKLLLIAVEGMYILRVGAPRERPLFNIILSPDSLFGVRFTSSYDFLFALLALSPRRQLRRLSIIGVIIIVSETRLVFLLAGMLLGWRLLGSKRVLQMLLVSVPPVLILVGVIAHFAQQSEKTPRILQISGSSLGDKIEQIDAVGQLLRAQFLLVGKGLGVSLPGIVRDETRPYSYEAQVPVLVYQGGLLFFAVYSFIVGLYIRRHLALGLTFIFLFSMLNPTMFSLAAAYFLAVFSACLDQREPHAAHRVTRAKHGPVRLA